MLVLDGGVHNGALQLTGAALSGHTLADAVAPESEAPQVASRPDREALARVGNASPVRTIASLL